MKRFLLLPLSFLLSNGLLHAAVFTSIASGAYNTASSWSFTGSDGDGIPDADDDVTIAAAHNVTNNVISACRNLTIQGTLTASNSMVLTIYGNYVVTGAEAGVGAIVFSAGLPNLTISGSGAFAPLVRYTFNTNCNRTISAGTTIVKTGAVGITVTTVTNLGNVTLATVNTYSGAIWTNGPNSTLTLTLSGFLNTAGRTFNADATGNTVIIKYATGAIPTPANGYYNLNIAYTSGAKTLPAATTVLNNLTINAANTLNANGFDLSVAGNWANSGTFTPGTNAVILNGTTTQTISGTATNNNFYKLSKNAASTATLTANITVSNLLNISAGTLDAGTFGITGAAGLTMTGGDLREGKLGTMPELTGAYNLTGGKVSLTGAGAQTVKTGITYFDLQAIGSGVKSLAGVLNLNGSLYIGSTLDVTAANNYAVNLKGDWMNDGTFSQQLGTVTLNGTALQHFSGSATTTFEQLVINNTAGAIATGGAYTINGVLTLSNGTLNTGGKTFTMISNASKTARIAPIAGTGAITGNFTIQRFITTRDTTWTDLSSPVRSTTFGDWANELPAIFYGYSVPNQYPTQYFYDETADDFTPITSAGTALVPGQGVEIYMSGDFAYHNLPNTTINTIGVPNQGNQDLSGLITFNNAGSNLVGNPFASSISWSSVLAASSGILSTYDEYDYTTGTYSTHGVGTEIGATQGFWVYTTTGSAHLRVNESAKTTSSNSTIRSAVAEPYFTLKLASNIPGNTYSHTLKVAASDVASDGWDDSDHPYRKSPNKAAPAIYTLIGAKKSVINSFSLSNDSYSMPIRTFAGVSGSYKLEAAGFENMSDYSCMKLEDKALNKMIDLNAVSTYTFQMNVGDNADRFILHFSKNGDCRSLVADNNSSISTLEDQVSILPSPEGNAITFNLDEATPASITVTNVLGQALVEGTSLTAQSQTVNIALPQDFSGMYIVRIESAKGVITKKYVRK